MPRSQTQSTAPDRKGVRVIFGIRAAPDHVPKLLPELIDAGALPGSLCIGSRLGYAFDAPLVVSPDARGKRELRAANPALGLVAAFPGRAETIDEERREVSIRDAGARAISLPIRCSTMQTDVDPMPDSGGRRCRRHASAQIVTKRVLAGAAAAPFLRRCTAPRIDVETGCAQGEDRADRRHARERPEIRIMSSADGQARSSTEWSCMPTPSPISCAAWPCALSDLPRSGC